MIVFALSESADPNCEVVELEDGTGALVALKPLAAGDWLSVAYSDDEEENDSGEEEKDYDE